MSRIRFDKGIAGLGVLLLVLSTQFALVAVDSTPAAADGPPAVISLTPDSGAISGGTSVTITGSGFTGALGVSFGSGASPDFSIVSDTSIIATSPAAPVDCTSYPCPLDVTVTTTAGTSETRSADAFTYEGVPTVTGLVSGSAPTTGGTTIIVEGTNLLGPEAVDFASVAAPSVTVVSSTELEVVTPSIGFSHTSGMTYNVTVSTGAGTSTTSPASNFYWFGTGSCSFTGSGVTDAGVPPGSTAYLIDANPSTQSSTGSITSGSPTLSDTNTDFTDADVGLGVVVAGGGGSGNSLNTSIVAVTSTSSITMATDANATISGTASYTIGQAVGTSCAQLSGISLTSPFLETMNDAPQGVTTGTGPGGNTGNESWLGWTGVNGYVSNSGTTYSTSGAGFVLPATGGGTSGGCPLSPALCTVAAEEGAAPYSATDPQGSCPPSQTLVDAGFVDCSVETQIEGNDTSYVAAQLAVETGGTPVPDQPTATLTPASSLAPGNTVEVTSCDTCSWWGSGAVGSPGFMAPVGPGASATSIPAPTVWVGLTRASAVEASDSTVSITPSTYACTGGGAYSTSAAAEANPANCTTGQGTIGGTFTFPAGTGCSATCNVFIDEPNTTLLQGEYGGGGSYNDGLSYSLVNAVESTTAVTVGAGAAPNVTAITPGTGSTLGGASVTIAGLNLGSATAVDFGGTSATSFTANSSTSITAIAPPETAGTVDVTVTTPSGTSAFTDADQFTFGTPPTVTSLTPANGFTYGGASVVIAGSDFTGATAVDFGGTAATSFTVDSDSSITAVAPPESTGTVDVTVTTPDGTSTLSSADQFLFIDPPVVTSLHPSDGLTSGGTVVSITGEDFTDASAVDFGGTPATSFTVNSSTSITAIAPPETAGTVDVTVSNGGGSSPLVFGDHFTYGDVPTVTSVEPAMGPTSGGTDVVITGTNFNGTDQVEFGSSNSSTWRVVSDTTIDAVTPPHVAGVVNVTVFTVFAASAPSSADQFTYNRPNVTRVSPSTVSTGGGNTVTVTGSNFTGATAVDFGTQPASSFTVLDSRQLRAVAPARAAGIVDVTVTTPVATSPDVAADRVTYQVPAVTRLVLSSGSANVSHSVTITGVQLGLASAVDFGTTPAVSFRVISNESIVAVAPPEAPATVAVMVTTTAGVTPSTTATNFTYLAPKVTSVTPRSGPAGGGTTVAIRGTLFGGASAVTFSGVPATSFTRTSPGVITAVAPPHADGVTDVQVTATAGTSAPVTADHFTFR